MVAQTLQTTKVAREIDAYAKGSTFREISLEALRKIPFPLATTLPEQRKIADFLTAVDGRIVQLIQKKALLEATKKGVMHQLFTQALRFKHEKGKDFPEWEEKKFVKIFRELMRSRNILESFSEFEDDDLALSVVRFNDYKSAYLVLYDKLKTVIDRYVYTGE